MPRPALFRLALAGLTCAFAAAGVAGPSTASASEPAPGRPRVVLERLSFPDMPEASYYKSHLRRSLQREVRLADWGAGAGSTIQYRFRIDSLRIERTSSLVRVYCSAIGELPRNKTATSRLAFGGEPRRERHLVSSVLSIVARGVITRLAQIEHARRAAAAEALKPRAAMPR